MARAALGITRTKLAGKAGVSDMTIARFENGDSRGYADTVAALRAALEEQGITFLKDDGSGPGVRYREPQIKMDL